MANNERERDRQKFKSQTNEHTKDGQKVCNTAQLQFFDTRRRHYKNRESGRKCKGMYLELERFGDINAKIEKTEFSGIIQVNTSLDNIKILDNNTLVRYFYALG